VAIIRLENRTRGSYLARKDMAGKKIRRGRREKIYMARKKIRLGRREKIWREEIMREGIAWPAREKIWREKLRGTRNMQPVALAVETTTMTSISYYYALITTSMHLIARSLILEEDTSLRACWDLGSYPEGTPKEG